MSQAEFHFDVLELGNTQAALRLKVSGITYLYGFLGRQFIVSLKAWIFF
jgi:hypothetical protein